MAMYGRVFKFLSVYNDIYCIYNLQNLGSIYGSSKTTSTPNPCFWHLPINITESIRSALDNDKTVCGIFVDLQKAFDTVNHEILIDKLNYYGIRGTANTWFKSYLSNRKQFVSINGFNSDTMNITHGVPQGSVLGPLLFLLYINDLHISIKHSKVYHFADDTNLLHTNESLKKTKKYLNLDLRYLHNWLLANKISLNCSKTELIFFHKPSTKVPHKPKIKINGNYLTHQHAIRYLGIHLDETLSGDYHCLELSKKLSRANGMLAKTRHYAPNEILPIYHALFSSHLKFGSQVWGQTNNLHVQKIIKLQKRALRIISFSEFRAHTSPLFKEHNILKFQDHVVLENCLLIHDFLKNKLPQSFHNYFKTTKAVYNRVSTRNSKNGSIFVPYVKSTKYGLNSIKISAILSWNKFAKQFENNDSNILTLSRSALKKYIFESFINSY